MSAEQRGDSMGLTRLVNPLAAFKASVLNNAGRHLSLSASFSHYTTIISFPADPE